jgi:hypothetical protein
VTGAAVFRDPIGKPGVLAYSERYKTEIAGIGGRTQNLSRLRPVSFDLKSDPQGIRYDELAPILIRVVQVAGGARGAAGAINSLAAMSAYTPGPRLNRYGRGFILAHVITTD